MTDNRLQLTDAARIEQLALAGDSRITLQSIEKGNRYTYRFKQEKLLDLDKGTTSNFYFVSVLSGPDNSADYQYIGFINTERQGFRLVAGKKGKPAAPSFKALEWFLRHLGTDGLEKVDVWHESQCCACGKPLTTPESIERRMGPVCAKRAGL